MAQESALCLQNCSSRDHPCNGGPFKVRLGKAEFTQGGLERLHVLLGSGWPRIPLILTAHQDAWVARCTAGTSAPSSANVATSWPRNALRARSTPAPREPDADERSAPDVERALVSRQLAL